MHNHLRQNMCPAHQNRNLANGPSHPRLDPEEIQMADVSALHVNQCWRLLDILFRLQLFIMCDIKKIKMKTCTGPFPKLKRERKLIF